VPPSDLFGCRCEPLRSSASCGRPAPVSANLCLLSSGGACTFDRLLAHAPVTRAPPLTTCVRMHLSDPALARCNAGAVACVEGPIALAAAFDTLPATTAQPERVSGHGSSWQQKSALPRQHEQRHASRHCNLEALVGTVEQAGTGKGPCHCPLSNRLCQRHKVAGGARATQAAASRRRSTRRTTASASAAPPSAACGRPAPPPPPTGPRRTRSRGPARAARSSPPAARQHREQVGALHHLLFDGGNSEGRLSSSWFLLVWSGPGEAADAARTSEAASERLGHGCA
jgi:hypothetical protein